MRDYQENVPTGQTDRQTHGRTDAGQSDPYVSLCFTGDTKTVNRYISPLAFHYEVFLKAKYIILLIPYSDLRCLCYFLKYFNIMCCVSSQVNFRLGLMTSSMRTDFLQIVAIKGSDSQ